MFVIIDSEPWVDVRNVDDILQGQLDDTQWKIFANQIPVVYVEFDDILGTIEILHAELEILLPFWIPCLKDNISTL